MHKYRKLSNKYIILTGLILGVIYLVMWALFGVLGLDVSLGGLLAFLIVMITTSLILNKLRKLTRDLNSFAVLTFSALLSISVSVLFPLVAFWVIFTSQRPGNPILFMAGRTFIISLIIAIIVTTLEAFKYKKELTNSKINFTNKAKEKVSFLLKKKLINKTPKLCLFNEYINILLRLFKQNREQEAWYTNEEFANKSQELVDLLDFLKEEKLKEIKLVNRVFNGSYYREDKFSSIFSVDNFNSPMSQCYSILKGKSGEDDVKKILDSFEILYYDSFDLKDESTDKSVELDFITVLGGIIYIIEVKNHSANSIKLNSTGQFIKELKNGKNVKDDVLGQITNHNQLLRRVIGSKVNILNFLVLTDKNTFIEDEFNNENIELLYVDGLEFKMRQNQSEEDRNLLVKINEYRTQPRKFPFFNIDSVLLDLNNLKAEEDSITLGLQIQELLTTTHLNEFKLDVEGFILDELQKIEGYAENKSHASELVRELSAEAIEDYKALLAEVSEVYTSV